MLNTKLPLSRACLAACYTHNLQNVNNTLCYAAFRHIFLYLLFQLLNIFQSWQSKYRKSLAACFMLYENIQYSIFNKKHQQKQSVILYWILNILNIILNIQRTINAWQLNYKHTTYINSTWKLAMHISGRKINNSQVLT